MSISRMADIWRHSRQKGSTLLILLALADHADDNGLCWPSIGLLAAKSRLSERSVARLTSNCCDQGELLRLSRAEDGRSNLYIVLPGLSIRKLGLAMRKARSMMGDDILSRVYPEEWIPIVDSLIADGKSTDRDDKLSSLPDNLSWVFTQRGDNLSGVGGDNLSGGDDIAMSGGDDTAMSGELSLPVNDPSEKQKHSGADAPADSPSPEPESEPDDSWLDETRLDDHPSRLDDPEALQGLSHEERSAIASPASPDTPSNVGEPAWIGLMRMSRKRGFSYNYGMTTEDVVVVIGQFIEHAAISPPTTRPLMRGWHAGATRFLYEVYGQLPKSMRGDAEWRRRAIGWLIALFFHDTCSPVPWIEVQTPASMINSVPVLASHLRIVAEWATLDLDSGQLPTEEQLIAHNTAHPRRGAKRERGDQGDDKWKRPDDERKRQVVEQLYPATNGAQH